MGLKAIRAKAGRSARKAAKCLGMQTNGPTEVSSGMPAGARAIDPDRFKEASPSHPVLPNAHPLLTTPRIEYQGTWVHQLKNCKVFGPTVAVVDADGGLLADVSVEWGQRPEENWTFRRTQLAKPQVLKGKTLVLASTGGDTYFHWMTDVLPRIRLAQMAGQEFSSFDRILVNGLDQPFQKESLARWGLPPGRCQRLPAREGALLLENAILPSLPGVPGVIPAESVDFLRGAFAGPRSAAAKKIFIGRKGAKHRPLVEEGEISARLAEKGFQPVKCEGLSIQAQAEIFSSAEIIVGAHGAALTNLVFCRPGTRVVELFSPRYVNPCYRDLCVAAGLRHAAVIGNGQDWILSTKHDEPSAPITASRGLVERVLEELDR